MPRSDPERPAARLSLHEALIALRDRHACPVSYYWLWTRVVGGKVPAERGPGGRMWTIDPADLPAIAATRRPPSVAA